MHKTAQSADPLNWLCYTYRERQVFQIWHLHAFLQRIVLSEKNKTKHNRQIIRVKPELALNEG